MIAASDIIKDWRVEIFVINLASDPLVCWKVAKEPVDVLINGLEEWVFEHIEQ